RVTDAAGRVVFTIVPDEHSVSAHVHARAPDGTVCARCPSGRLPDGSTGELRASLPVVPGAMHAELDADGVRVASPVEQAIAYYAFFDRSARLAGGALRLERDGRGGSAARTSLPDGARAPLWLVVSSEPDLRSPSAVGWPILPEGDEPPRT